MHHPLYKSLETLFFFLIRVLCEETNYSLQAFLSSVKFSHLCALYMKLHNVQTETMVTKTDLQNMGFSLLGFCMSQLMNKTLYKYYLSHLLLIIILMLGTCTNTFHSTHNRLFWSKDKLDHIWRGVSVKSFITKDAQVCNNPYLRGHMKKQHYTPGLSTSSATFKHAEYTLHSCNSKVLRLAVCVPKGISTYSSHTAQPEKIRLNY